KVAAATPPATCPSEFRPGMPAAGPVLNDSAGGCPPPPEKTPATARAPTASAVAARPASSPFIRAVTVPPVQVGGSAPLPDPLWIRLSRQERFRQPFCTQDWPGVLPRSVPSSVRRRRMT